MEKSLTSKLTSPLGRIPENWSLVQLKDITLKIGSGATPRGGSRVYLPERENAALIRSQNVFDRYFDDTGLAFISNKHAEQLSSVIVLPDDVLLNITGDGITYGRACRVQENILPAYVNQHVAIIRPNPNLCSSGYLLSYLTHPQIKVYMESFNAGGSRRAITKGHIESFEIPLPPLPTQRRIAEILGRLDDKIETNRRINRTLEAMAQALFKHHFVDFGPYQDGPFVESELGLIPEGWEVTSVGSVCQVVSGGTPKTTVDEYWNGDVYWATPTDMTSLAAPVIFDTARKITQLGLEQSSAKF